MYLGNVLCLNCKSLISCLPLNQRLSNVQHKSGLKAAVSKLVAKILFHFTPAPVMVDIADGRVYILQKYSLLIVAFYCIKRKPHIISQNTVLIKPGRQNLWRKDWNFDLKGRRI